MSVGACADLCVQWNEDYDEDWGLSDPVTLAGQDLTGWVLAMQVRAAAGAPGAPLLTLAIVTDAAVTGILITSLIGGQFTVRIKQADLETLAQANGQQNVLRYAYDFVATDANGVRQALVGGAFILEPGVTL